MIRPDIQAIAAKWIHELRLQDRFITVRYATNLCDPSGNLVYGLMTIQNLDEGRFLIEVQDPSTWPVDGSRQLSAQSIEEGIVHELVHIRWIDLTVHNPDPAAIVQEERATWATARALVRANSTTRAAIVRAMAAQTAAMRRQTKGKAMDLHSIAALLAVIMAASTPEEKDKLLSEMKNQVDQALSGGGSGPPSAPDAMPQDAGNDMHDKDKEPMPMQYESKMARAMDKEVAEVRAMKAELSQGLKLIRPAVKTELVRSMRADGIVVTPHAEKLILDAPTIEVAKERAEGMRAMHTGAASRRSSQPANGATGLTATQQKEYERIARTNPNRAEMYRSECVKGGAK